MPKEFRATIEEMHKRIGYVANQLLQGVQSSKVYAYLRSEFGLSTRACAIYVSKARKMILREIGSSASDLQMESYLLYRTIATDPNNKARDRIRAQMAIDRLLGLHRQQPDFDKPLPKVVTDDDIPIEQLQSELFGILGSAVQRLRFAEVVSRGEGIQPAAQELRTGVSG